MLSLQNRLGYIQTGLTQNQKFFIQNVAKASVRVYQALGVKPLEKLLLQYKTQDNLRVYLILPDEHMIPTLENKELAQQLMKDRKPIIFSDFYQIHNYFIYTLSSKNKTYKVALALTHSGRDSYIDALPIPLRVLVSLMIISSVLYIVVSVVHAPLRLIMKAINQLSSGKLDARVHHLLQNRNDDLAKLGRDFDKIADNLESLIQAKEQTFHQIAHELRSPLARIRMAATLLEPSIPKTHLHDLETIEAEAWNIDQLVGEILSLAKLNTLTQEIEKEEFNLSHAIQNLIDAANYEINQARVHANVDGNMLFYGNEKLLKRAIENIIRNALNHAGDKAIIHIDTLIKEESFQITVEDNGPGIDNTMLNTVFEPFIQAPQTQAQAINGYGLGLAISKKIISAHNGEIKAENIQPNGLKISITLPINFLI